MASPSLSNAEKAALLDLLDDASPAVRGPLLEHFARLGPVGRDLLRETADGTNRHLAWHARAFLEHLHYDNPSEEFRTFIASLRYELETGALLLARTVRPNLDAAACCTELDRIAARCRELIVEPASAREQCRSINRVLFHECGFRGNTERYNDPDNSFLDQVLARRRGLPISLSIVYLLVARRLGLELEPIGLPGHFMVASFVDDTPFFIDPFDGGLFYSPAEVMVFLRARSHHPTLADLAPTPVREVLCRCCRNLGQHYDQHGDTARSALFESFVLAFEETHTRNSM